MQAVSAAALLLAFALACCGERGPLIERVMSPDGGAPREAAAETDAPPPEDAKEEEAWISPIDSRPMADGPASPQDAGGTCEPRATAVAAAQSAACVLRNDGKVLCWGENAGSIFGLPMRRPLSKPFVLPDVQGVSKIVGGGSAFCASFTKQGEPPRCWGAIRFSDGTSYTLLRTAPLPGEMQGDVMVIGGGLCALKAGKLTCWGGAWKQPKVLAASGVTKAVWESDIAVLSAALVNGKTVWTRHTQTGMQNVVGIPEGITLIRADALAWAYTTGTGTLAMTEGMGMLPSPIMAWGADNGIFALSTYGRGGCVQKTNGKMMWWDVPGQSLKEVSGVMAGLDLFVGWNACVLQKDGRVLCWAGPDWPYRSDTDTNVGDGIKTPTFANLCP